MSGITRVLLATVLVIAAAGCEPKKPPHDSQGLYESKRESFRHGELGPGWTRSRVEGTLLAFDEKALGATITVSSECKDVEDISLRALVQQELIGLEEKQILSQGNTPLDGREGADWVVKGSLDGVPVQLDLVVLRRGKCVHDLMLVSGVDSFEEARADFRTFVRDFDVLE